MPDFERNEVDTIYADPKDRFVVSLIVTYGDTEGIKSAVHAAAGALGLTRDAGSNDTKWYVYDRQKQKMYEFEQGDFEDIVDFLDSYDPIESGPEIREGSEHEESIRNGRPFCDNCSFVDQDNPDPIYHPEFYM